MTQEPWVVQVLVRATEEELDLITGRISQAICVPPEHEGPCPTPWTLTTSRVEDHDEPERAALLGLLDD